MLSECCPDVVSMLSHCCLNVVSVLSQCCPNVVSMLSQCCLNVVSMLSLEALKIGEEPMLSQFCLTVVQMLSLEATSKQHVYFQFAVPKLAKTSPKAIVVPMLSLETTLDNIWAPKGASKKAQHQIVQNHFQTPRDNIETTSRQQ